MPKPAKGSRLGSGPAHEKLILAGLAAALFREERITTTATKARRLRPVAEKLITTAKEGTVASRRRALAVVEDRDIIHKLYSDIAPRFAERNGGYTRIIKLGPRKGDAAPLVLIELVEGAAPQAKPAEEERRRRLLRRRDRGDKSTEEAPASGGRFASRVKTGAPAKAAPAGGDEAGADDSPGAEPEVSDPELTEAELTGAEAATGEAATGEAATGGQAGRAEPEAGH